MRITLIASEAFGAGSMRKRAALLDGHPGTWASVGMRRIPFCATVAGTPLTHRRLQRAGGG